MKGISALAVEVIVLDELLVVLVHIVLDLGYIFEDEGDADGVGGDGYIQQ